MHTTQLIAGHLYIILINIREYPIASTDISYSLTRSIFLMFVRSLSNQIQKLLVDQNCI